jgi:hypothetical protein
MRIIISLLTILLTCSVAHAASYYYCAHGNSYIHLGDSLLRVKQICGEPDATTVKTVNPEKPGRVIRWFYNFKFHTTDKSIKKSDLNFHPMHVDFDTTGTVIGITDKGKQVKSTNYCSPNTYIKVGDSMNFIFLTCQAPLMRYEFTAPLSQTNAILQTTLIYKYDTLSPPVKFIFHDMKLVEIGK